MKKERFYISTIAPDAAAAARQHGLGLEIAEYSTAYNMDEHFAEAHAAVSQKLLGITRRTFHGPFNELFPCAIDPKARELARSRFLQAIDLARDYNADKIVLHGGYNPRLYYPCWYTEQSVPFWREFLKELAPGITICLENVFEEEPQMLLDIVRAVDHPRLRLCLDTGHVNTYSKVPVMEWLEACAPYITHFHLHNNDSSQDAHCTLNDGSIPMEALLRRADALCPDATFTLEVLQAQPSVDWLLERGII